MQKSLVTPGAGGGHDERGSAGNSAGSTRGVSSDAGAVDAAELVVGATGSERTCAAGPVLRLP